MQEANKSRDADVDLEQSLGGKRKAKRKAKQRKAKQLQI
jgi:hypothetical protein